MYRIEFTKRAKTDLEKLQKSSPTLIKKVKVLLSEIAEHPRTGTGQVEQLKGFEIETWSRRIDKKHRIVYEVREETIEVLVLSTYGHYQDK